MRTGCHFDLAVLVVKYGAGQRIRGEETGSSGSSNPGVAGFVSPL
jgi:hypothetical protein